MKKRSLLISTLVVLSLVCVSCGTSDDSKAAPAYKEVTESTLGKNFGEAPKTAPGFDGKTISLGVITPLTGLPGFLGTAIRDGAQTYWDAKNANGGVAGKYKVEMIVKDSASKGTYDKTISLKAYEELSPQVVAFQQVLGTDVVLGLHDQQVKDKKIIAPATLSGSWVRNPLVLPVANPYQTQAINGVSYFVENTSVDKPVVCSLALDDTFGDDGVAGVTYATDKLGVTYKSKQQFTTNSPIASQVDALISNKCNAVVVVATAVDVKTVLEGFAQKNADMTLIGLSPLWIPQADLTITRAVSDYAKEHLWIVSAGAKWGDESVPGMAKMMGDVRAYKSAQKSNPFFLYGYAQAWAMDQVLEKAVINGDLSSAGVAAALANVGTFTFEGLLPDYEFGANSSTRKVPSENTIFIYTQDDPSLLTPVADDAINYASEYAGTYEYKP